MARLRVHLMQNWFGYSDPAMEKALYDTTILRQFSGLSLERIPDESTILNFRRRLLPGVRQGRSAKFRFLLLATKLTCPTLETL